MAPSVGFGVKLQLQRPMQHSEPLGQFASQQLPGRLVRKTDMTVLTPAGETTGDLWCPRTRAHPARGKRSVALTDRLLWAPQRARCQRPTALKLLPRTHREQAPGTPRDTSGCSGPRGPQAPRERLAWARSCLPEGSATCGGEGGGGARTELTETTSSLLEEETRPGPSCRLGVTHLEPVLGH